MLDEAPRHDDTLEVAFICTGNLARSPYAAELLRRHTENLPVRVRSFGTLDVGPVPALRNARWAASSFGVDLTQHRAQVLETGALGSTDLAIGFESFHVATAVIKGGARRERTFLITELAEILDSIRILETTAADPTPEQLIMDAHAMRTSRPFFSRALADPAGKSKKSFRTSFEEINGLVEGIAIGLLGDPAMRMAKGSAD